MKKTMLTDWKRRLQTARNLWSQDKYEQSRKVYTNLLCDTEATRIGDGSPEVRQFTTEFVLFGYESNPLVMEIKRLLQGKSDFDLFIKPVLGNDLKGVLTNNPGYSWDDIKEAVTYIHSRMTGNEITLCKKRLGLK